MPVALRREIEFAPNGRPRSPRRIRWFYRHMEIGDASKAAEEAGYKGRYVSRMGTLLKYEFAPLIAKCAPYQGAMVLPLAIATLTKVMQNFDPTATIEVEKTLLNGVVERSIVGDPNRASPAAAAAATKAAGEIMDRVGMPKTTNLVIGTPDDTDGDDFRKLIDRMVAVMHIDAVRAAPFIKDYREYREYLEEKYGGLEVVGESGPMAGEIVGGALEIAGEIK